MDLKTRHYTYGLLTFRTPTKWFFPLSIDPADYMSPGRLLFWCPWHQAGKQHPKSQEGLGDFDERPLATGSTTPLIEDKLSANVSRKSNLDMLPPFVLYMMNALRQTTSRRQRTSSGSTSLDVLEPTCSFAVGHHSCRLPTRFCNTEGQRTVSGLLPV